MSNFGILAINLEERKDKWNKLCKHFDVPIERIPGVNLKRNPKLYKEAVSAGKHPDVPLTRHGYVGLALAHILAWETVANRNIPHLIVEDDVIPRQNWRENVSSLIDVLESQFDFMLVNALRPTGTHIGHELLKFDTSRSYLVEPLPNVWLSSYVLTPNGARTLLQIMKNAQYDMNVVQLDHALIMSVGGTNIDFYVVSTTNKYFIHDETDSDKEKLNGGLTNYKILWTGLIVVLVLFLLYLPYMKFVQRPLSMTLQKKGSN